MIDTSQNSLAPNAQENPSFSLRLIKTLRTVSFLFVMLVILIPTAMFNIRQFVERNQVLADEVTIFSRLINTLPNHEGETAEDRWRHLAYDVFGTQVSVAIQTPTGLIESGPTALEFPVVHYARSFHNPTQGDLHISTRSSLGSTFPYMMAVAVLGFLLVAIAIAGLNHFLFSPWISTERSRRRNIERIVDIAQVSSDWFWEMDTDLRFVLNTMPPHKGSWTRESIIGKRLWEMRSIRPEGGWDRFRTLLKECIPFRLQYEVTTESGLGFHEITGSPFFDEFGNFEGYRGAGRDVTVEMQRQAELERHRDELHKLVEEQTEDLLRMSREADSANRAKSMFLATMSHEIRTPLNSIIGLTYLAQKLNPQGEVADHLKNIARSGELLLNLINDILDFSKIEADKLELDILPFDISSLLEEVISLMRPRAEAKGLQLLAQPQCEVQRLFLGDRHRLTQMLINLLSNAVKFTERGSVQIHVDCEIEDDRTALLRFEVNDTGIGMTYEQQSRVFESFEQAAGGTTRLFGGTGLGLAIVRNLARLMNGETGVISELGQGSCFWFTARLALGKASHSQATSLPSKRKRSPDSITARPLEGSKILAVDDDTLHLRMISEMLESHGANVIIASDHDQALLTARNTGPFDLALIDINMPGKNGRETAINLHLLPGHEKTPVLAISANATTEEVENCKRAGMRDMIPKPFDASILVSAVSSHLLEQSQGTERESGTEASQEAHTRKLLVAGRIQELCHLLESGASDSIAEASAIDTDLKQLLGKQYNSLSIAVENFDFASAADILRNALNQ